MIIKDTELVDLHTSTGPMRTYLFRPVAEGRYPGLVLFSKIFQVTGPIRRAAAMLASHGFVVAVPEIYYELGMSQRGRESFLVRVFTATCLHDTPAPLHR